MDVSLRVLLGRIRTTISPVTRLVAIPTWQVRWQNIGTALPRSIFGKETMYPLQNLVLA
jgi:hypothetical protein